MTEEANCRVRATVDAMVGSVEQGLRADEASDEAVGHIMRHFVESAGARMMSYAPQVVSEMQRTLDGHDIGELVQMIEHVWELAEQSEILTKEYLRTLTNAKVRAINSLTTYDMHRRGDD